ncbi:molybdenum cofactor guanylyltransferase [Ruminococcus sp. AM40-10AC]|jgi:molybdopterin-guanine dinucleotide biosynthesis protein A|nr:molybdenum cofactor guanylyltransferase [Ruminococcus sp. AF14-5]RHT03630.1 molybdenum cofactor guanylyltransferase [Ruminococcus sp. AM40-10AC]
MRKKEISMIILAGGASSRMGRDKSDLTIDGKTFLEMQIEKGEKLGISDILLSGYHGENKYKYPIIPDRFPGKGPLGGLEACFRKAKNPYCLVLGVDVPLVPAEELTALIRQSLHSDVKAVILSHGGHEEPLMGVYCTDLADAMLEEITERKGAVFAFLRKNGYECYESQAAAWYFSNINDSETYKEIAGNHFIEKYV